jgi:GT2 family glycosyltransferase
MSATDASPSRTVAIAFDEGAYLATFKDVTIALANGAFRTAREHFDAFGAAEDRLADEAYIRALGLAPERARPGRAIELTVDTIMCSRHGSVLITGWMDDRDSPVASISLFAGGRGWNTTAFSRVRRPDVEAVRPPARGHSFGFWAVLNLNGRLSITSPWVIRARRADGRLGEVKHKASLVSDTALRSAILTHFAATDYFGSRIVEGFLALDSGIGEALVQLNRRITASLIAGARVTHHGPVRKAYAGSVIVCLYGKPEFMFLQAAFFSAGNRAQDYEFVYVCNSPELIELLEREASNCARIYGMSIVLVSLPDNAGFGAANNVAARFARSKRLLITNPDVFPRDEDWARRHTDIIENAPAAQTKLFGAPLYYDDGSLMHHGMYFEIDPGVSMRPGGIARSPMIRTEHYGKGVPRWTANFACPRPVSAVSGAFMSVDRAWFEALGGFNEDFLFGHYEDCDLCLKSLSRGVPAWVQDFPLWHMEGKGSTKRQAHEGGMQVNRWLFTRQWGDFISRELWGPAPPCPALHAG